MGKRVCPWWIGYFLLLPLRRLGQDPRKLLAPYVREGMTVLEPGPGMGFFTIDLLQMVGDSGRVIAPDVQAKMLDRLKKRADKAGVERRLDARLVSADSMNLGKIPIVDFTLAFAVVHEFPSAEKFFAEAAAASKPGATLLLAEPTGHVKEKEFEEELKSAAAAGFRVVDRPRVSRSHAALLRRN
ncbi:MAG TPA: methyltransferase domain-containing protein [Terriglobales bacterium]|nr:methyltransferase domain-containing protein [Terriglobales bacterium]